MKGPVQTLLWHIFLVNTDALRLSKCFLKFETHVSFFPQLFDFFYQIKSLGSISDKSYELISIAPCILFLVIWFTEAWPKWKGRLELQIIATLLERRQNKVLQMLGIQHLRPCGLMDKAPDFGSGDCRFESCHGRYFLPFEGFQSASAMTRTTKRNKRM